MGVYEVFMGEVGGVCECINCLRVYEVVVGIGGVCECRWCF